MFVEFERVEAHFEQPKSFLQKSNSCRNLRKQENAGTQKMMISIRLGRDRFVVYGFYLFLCLV